MLGVFAVSMICGIISRMINKNSTYGAMVKLICGVFLLLALFSPLGSISLNGLTEDYSDFQVNAQLAVEEGKRQSAQALSQLIKERTEAYILTKAQGLNMELQVEVTLSDQEIPVPVKVKLAGNASPYGKGRLETIILEDLGIEKENQIWT